MNMREFIREQILHHICHFGLSIPMVLFIHPLFVLGLCCGLELAQHWEVVRWFLRGEELRTDLFGWWDLMPPIKWIDMVADLVSWNLFWILLLVF